LILKPRLVLIHILCHIFFVLGAEKPDGGEPSPTPRASERRAVNPEIKRRAEQVALHYDKEESSRISVAIIEFIVAEDVPSMEILRSAMYGQVERAKHRLAGLGHFHDLLTKVR